MAAPFNPGAIVLHPSHGVCRVVGVEHVTAGGERFDALAIAPAYALAGVIKIPLSKLGALQMRVLTNAEAADLIENWRPPKSRETAWRHFLMSRGGVRGREARASAVRMGASRAA